MTGENTIDIDEQRLGAELASVQLPQEAEPVQAPGAQAGQGGAVVPAGEPTLEQLQAAIPMWRMGSDIVTNLLCDVVAPNWNVTKDERRQVSDSISMALEAWFPGQYIPVKYQVLLGVGGAVWAIVVARRQVHGGKLPPLRLAPPGKTAGEKPLETEQPAAPAVTTSSGVTTSH